MAKKYNPIGYILTGLLGLLGVGSVLAQVETDEKTSISQPTDNTISNTVASLEKAARIGQKILTPFLYIFCVGSSIFLALIVVDSPHPPPVFPAWIIGAIVGLSIGWLLARALYHVIKWALVVLGIYVISNV